MPREVPTAPERRLRARLRKLAKDNPRYRYRRLHALLLREGYAVNHKRVQRLRRDEGLVEWDEMIAPILEPFPGALTAD